MIRGFFSSFSVGGDIIKVLGSFYLSLWLYLRISTLHPLQCLLKMSPGIFFVAVCDSGVIGALLLPVLLLLPLEHQDGRYLYHIQGCLSHRHGHCYVRRERRGAIQLARSASATSRFVGFMGANAVVKKAGVMGASMAGGMGSQGLLLLLPGSLKLWVPLQLGGQTQVPCLLFLPSALGAAGSVVIARELWVTSTASAAPPVLPPPCA